MLAEQQAGVPHGGRLLGALSPMNVNKRKATDTLFGFAFAASLAAAVALGSYAFTQNKYADLVNGPPASLKCDANVENLPRRVLRAVHGSSFSADPQPVSPSEDFKVVSRHASYLLVLALVLVFVGVMMIQTIKHCARAFVYASMLMIPISMLASAGSLYAAGSPTVAIVVLAFTALWCLLLWCSRHGLRLCAALLEQAATVLMLHPGLMLVALLLLLLTVALIAAALVALVVLYSNGRWVKLGGASSGCLWVVEPSSEAGMAYVAAVLLWSALLAFTMRFFIVALVTAMWYFDTSGGAVDPTSNAAGYQAAARRAPVCTATRLAFSSSFGTLCFSSLVLTVCQILKAMAKEAMRRTDNLLVCLVACCVRCILELIEFLNKFVVAMHAVSGQRFCAAGKEITGLFSRHGLNAWFCDRISAYVLSTASFSFAALGGGVTYLVIFETLAHPTAVDDKRIVAGAFGTVTFGLGWFILSFCASIILNIVDASYTCLAVDMDHGAPHQPQIRDAMIPIVKPEYVVVVQQPGAHPPVAMGVAVPVRNP